MSGSIVIGYDGSHAARRAIEAAAPIVRATEAIVAHVWTPTVGAATSMPLAGASLPPPEDDAELEAAAWQLAEDGVALAAGAGLHARPVVRCGTRADVGGLLAELADESDAELVVIGRQAGSRLEEVVFGSVSADTVRASRRPVLVVSSRTN
jgi:nucleotide-binding universal stress UspA family protein